jgi:hypothetical protein
MTRCNLALQELHRRDYDFQPFQFLLAPFERERTYLLKEDCASNVNVISL